MVAAAVPIDAPMKARENPFRSERVLAVRYRPQGEDWPQLLARIRRLEFRGAIVGPQGSGKTTLLQDLVPHLQRAGFQTLWFGVDNQDVVLDWPAMVARLRPVGPREVVLLDGADRLGWWRWRTLQRRTRWAGGLIITTHRPGRLPTLVRSTTSIELLEDLVRELAPQEGMQFGLRDLFRRHHGNIRHALGDLYHQCAVLPGSRAD